MHVGEQEARTQAAQYHTYHLSLAACPLLSRGAALGLLKTRERFLLHYLSCAKTPQAAP